MKLAVLYSGGKDSNLALHLAKQYEDVVCLIAIASKNDDSYMFHTPAITWTKLQAEKLQLPLIIKETEGKKEEELYELKEAIKQAIEEYQIAGVVTGAVESIYQASRVQKITDELGIECFNPLWQKDQMELLNDLVTLGFEVIISGVAADPFDESWLGRKIDRYTIAQLEMFKDQLKLNPAGEGGEYESFVINSPDFKEGIEIVDFEKLYAERNGRLIIKEAS